MSLSNVNPTTGIRYGLIDGADAPGLEEWIFDHGVDEEYSAFRATMLDSFVAIMKQASSATLSRLLSAVCDVDGVTIDDPDELHTIKEVLVEILTWEATNNIYTQISQAERLFNSMIGQDLITYTSNEFTTYTADDGINFFRMTTDRGNTIWCLNTSKIVYANRLCGPCMPNAGDLNSGITDIKEEGYECYGVPDNYL